MKALLIVCLEINPEDTQKAMQVIRHIPYTEYIGAYIMRDDAEIDEWVDSGKYLQEIYDTIGA